MPEIALEASPAAVPPRRYIVTRPRVDNVLPDRIASCTTSQDISPCRFAACVDTEKSIKLAKDAIKSKKINDAKKVIDAKGHAVARDASNVLFQEIYKRICIMFRVLSFGADHEAYLDYVIAVSDAKKAIREMKAAKAEFDTALADLRYAVNAEITDKDVADAKMAAELKFGAIYDTVVDAVKAELTAQDEEFAADAWNIINAESMRPSRKFISSLRTGSLSVITRLWSVRKRCLPRHFFHPMQQVRYSFQFCVDDWTKRVFGKAIFSSDAEEYRTDPHAVPAEILHNAATD